MNVSLLGPYTYIKKNLKCAGCLGGSTPVPSPGATCHSFCLRKCYRTGALMLSFLAITVHNEIGNNLDVETVTVSSANTSCMFQAHTEHHGAPQQAQ